MVNDIAVQEFVNAIKEPPQDTNNTYGATVSRIDDEGIVWVNIHGSDKETPTASTSTEVKRGDTVTVQWRNNKLYIGGNYSNPAAGMSTVMPSVDYVTELIDKDVTVTNISAATGYIGELEAKNITAEDLTADHATIKELDVESMAAATAYIGELTADDITAEDIATDHATIGNLDANYAQINAANVTDLSAQNAWVNKIMVQTGLLAHEGTVFTLDAIQVNAANITAGTIDVNRLIVTVDGEKYLVEIDPTTHQPSYEKLDGNIVEPRTITADKIVAHDITVQEITTENLVGTNGWINLNQGKFFYTTNGSTWANTTNGIMWDGTSLKIKGDVNITAGNVYTKTQTDTALGGKVGNNEVITKINASSEGVQIQASKVNIEGAAIFTSGRLSETNLDNSYDANGAATGAVNGLKTDLASESGTTVINGGHIATGTLDADKITAQSISIGLLNDDLKASLMYDGIAITTEYSENNIVYSVVLKNGGVDVTSNYPNGDYEWWRQLPDGREYLGQGYTKTMAKDDVSYGQTVYCTWTRRQQMNLLTNTGNKLRISTGAYLLGRSEY